MNCSDNILADETISTDFIKMPATKFLSVLFHYYGSIWIYLACCGVFIFLILGVAFDLRFCVVALLWVFIIVPLMMAYLYFFYGFQPLTAINIINHKILFKKDRLDIILNFSLNEDNKVLDIDKDSKNIKNHYGNGLGNNLITADFKDLKKKIIGPNYFLLFFSESRNGFLWIPFSSFCSGNQAMKALKICNPESYVNSSGK